MLFDFHNVVDNFKALIPKRRTGPVALQFEDLGKAPECFFDSSHSLDGGFALLRSDRTKEVYHLCAHCRTALAALLQREAIPSTTIVRTMPGPKDVRGPSGDGVTEFTCEPKTVKSK